MEDGDVHEARKAARPALNPSNYCHARLSEPLEKHPQDKHEVHLHR